MNNLERAALERVESRGDIGINSHTDVLKETYKAGFMKALEALNKGPVFISSFNSPDNPDAVRYLKQWAVTDERE